MNAADSPGGPGSSGVLLAELCVLLRRLDPVPPRITADAERAGTLLSRRQPGRRLALVTDSALRPALAGMRGGAGPRRLRFRCGDTVVDTELVQTAPGVLAAAGATRQAGETGAATVVWQWPGGAVSCPVDGAGTFRCGGVPAGPLRVLVQTASGTAASDWFTS